RPGAPSACSGRPQGLPGALLVIVRPVLSRYARNSPLPPASAAGLVHAAAMAGSRTRPNNVLAGGGTVDRNDANVMTHPVCVAAWQSGTCWNDPPTSFPFGTASVVPSRIADTSFD